MSDTAAIIYAALEDVTTDHIVTVQAAQQLAAEVAAALDANGYVVKKKPAPRKAAPVREPFAPNTGDSSLDDFMRAHHDPKYKPLPLPKSPSGYITGRLNEKAFDALQSSWEAHCAARRGDSDEAAALRAEDAKTLAEAIRIHRSPWTRRGDVYTSSEHGFTVEHMRSSQWAESYDGWKLTDPNGNVVRPAFSSLSDRDRFYRFEDAERAILLPA